MWHRSYLTDNCALPTSALVKQNVSASVAIELLIHTGTSSYLYLRYSPHLGVHKSMMAAKVISQETFDQVVEENMTEFDMERAEAVADAIEQFTSQGVDLTSLYTGVEERGAESNWPVVVAVGKLNEYSKEGKVFDEDAAAGLIKRIASEIRDDDSKFAAGMRHGLIPGIANIFLQGLSDEVFIDASELMAEACSRDMKAPISVGVPISSSVLSRAQKSASPQTIAAAFCCLKALCRTCTAHRKIFNSEGGLDILLQALQAHPGHETLVREVCGLIQSITSSASLPNRDGSLPEGPLIGDVVRSLIENGTFEELVRRFQDDKLPSLKVRFSVMDALQTLAVRTESCKSFVEMEAHLNLLQMLTGKERSNVLVARKCIALIKNIAAVDEYKKLFVSCGAVNPIFECMKLHLDDSKVQRHGCGAIAAITLRMPENSDEIVARGAPALLAAVLQKYRSDPSVARPACLAIRNTVCRREDLRATFAEEGIQELLRELEQDAFCRDVARAALHDLGFMVTMSSDYGTKAANFNPVMDESADLEVALREAAHPACK